jgi:hypothetical protein
VAVGGGYLIDVNGTMGLAPLTITGSRPFGLGPLDGPFTALRQPGAGWVVSYTIANLTSPATSILVGVRCVTAN